VVAGKANPVTSTLAKLMGVEIRHVGGDEDYQSNRDQLQLFDSDGRPLTREIMDASFDQMSTVSKAIDLLDSKREAKGLKDITVGAAIQKITHGLNLSKLTDRLQEWHSEILYGDDTGAANPANPDISLAANQRCGENVDLWYNHSTDGYEGNIGDGVVVGGFHALQVKMAAGLDIRLNTAVTAVAHKSRHAGVGVVLEAVSVNDSALAPKEFHSNYTIVTVPLGVLTVRALPPPPSVC
jgi:hypothetical protein